MHCYLFFYGNREVITVQIRRLNGDVWETVGRLAAYRTADGNYSQLPERATQKPQGNY
jgi:hypothetical protein